MQERRTVSFVIDIRHTRGRATNYSSFPLHPVITNEPKGNYVVVADLMTNGKIVCGLLVLFLEED